MDHEDTPEGRARHYAWLRTLTLEQRFQLMARLNREARLAGLAAIKLRYPNATDRECEVRLFVQNHGRKIAAQFLHDIPADA